MFLYVVGVSCMVLLVFCAAVLLFYSGVIFLGLPEMCSSKLIGADVFQNWPGITHFGLK